MNKIYSLLHFFLVGVCSIEFLFHYNRLIKTGITADVLVSRPEIPFTLLCALTPFQRDLYTELTLSKGKIIQATFRQANYDNVFPMFTVAFL
jgi:hypothetical protein